MRKGVNIYFVNIVGGLLLAGISLFDFWSNWDVLALYWT